MSKNPRKSSRLAEINKSFEYVKAEENLLTFSFKFFISGEKYGESFKTWEEKSYLADLMEKLKAFSGKTKVELLQESVLEEYGYFPPDSKFDMPPCFLDRKVNWARLEITGERRLIGVFMPQQDALTEKTVFYVVFLDMNHNFAPSYYKTKRRK